LANNSKAAQEEANRIAQQVQQTAAQSNAAVASLGPALKLKPKTPQQLHRNYITKQTAQKTARITQLTQEIRELQQAAPDKDLQKLPDAQRSRAVQLLRERKRLDEQIAKLNPHA